MKQAGNVYRSTKITCKNLILPKMVWTQRKTMNQTNTFLNYKVQEELYGDEKWDERIRQDMTSNAIFPLKRGNSMHPRNKNAYAQHHKINSMRLWVAGRLNLVNLGLILWLLLSKINGLQYPNPKSLTNKAPALVAKEDRRGHY